MRGAPVPAPLFVPFAEGSSRRIASIRSCTVSASATTRSGSRTPHVLPSLSISSTRSRLPSPSSRSRCACAPRAPSSSSPRNPPSSTRSCRTVPSASASTMALRSNCILAAPTGMVRAESPSVRSQKPHKYPANTSDEASLPPEYRWFKFRYRPIVIFRSRRIFFERFLWPGSLQMNQVLLSAGRNGAFAGFRLAFVELMLGSRLIQLRIAGDKEDPMSAFASSAGTKPYKGLGMEGAVAKWYASLTKKSLEDFKALARRIAAQIPGSSNVLEVAPGPGYCAIELANLGNYEIVGLDISKTFVEIARENAARAGVR